MSIRRILLSVWCISVLLMPAVMLAQNPPAGAGGGNDGIFLLEPIGGVGEIPTVGNEGLGVFQFYFNLLYPWVVGMGAGIAVFMGVIGGIQIIQAGSDQAGVSAGKNRLLLSMAGLLIILASATILNALNPTFYQ